MMKRYGRLMQGRETGRLENQIHVVNPPGEGGSAWMAKNGRPVYNYPRTRFLLAFGAYGWTKLLVWANYLEDALDEAIDWIADNAPGLLCNDQVAEDYREALARLTEENAALPEEERRSEEDLESEAYDESTEDTTCGGNAGDYILSHEWCIMAEDPSREDLLQVMDRDREPKNARERRHKRRRELA